MRPVQNRPINTECSHLNPYLHIKYGTTLYSWCHYILSQTPKNMGTCDKLRGRPRHKCPSACALRKRESRLKRELNTSNLTNFTTFILSLFGTYDKANICKLYGKMKLQEEKGGIVHATFTDEIDKLCAHFNFEEVNNLENFRTWL